MPAAPSSSRATAARRPCRAGPSWSISSRTAAPIPAARGRRRSSTSTGRRRRDRDWPRGLRAGHRPPRQFEDLADALRRRPRSGSATSSRWRCRRRSRSPAATRLRHPARRPLRLRGAVRAPPARGLWIGRPIELPGSRPLRFEGGRTSAHAGGMAAEPRRQVPGASTIPTTRRASRRQERQLLRLFDACRKTRTSCCSRSSRRHGCSADADTVARAMRPALRRSASSPTGGSWSRRRRRPPGAASQRRDRTATTRTAAAWSCWPRGAGGGAGGRLQLAARQPMVKGFAVGRTHLRDAARTGWPASIDDERGGEPRWPRSYGSLVAACGRMRAAAAQAGELKAAIGHERPSRLTAAQALVRYLAAQCAPRCDGTRERALRRRLGDLRPRQCRRPGRGAARRARRAADLSRAQRAGAWRMPPSPIAKAEAPPAHDGLHHLDRPGRHQHGDRRGAGACQPPAGAVPAGRRLRQPPARSGAAAGRGFRRRHGHAPTTASARCRAISTASRGPSSS